jgi:rare lipoprotein A
MSFVGWGGSFRHSVVGGAHLSDAHLFLPAKFRNVVRMCAAIVVMATLGACAQTSVYSNKSEFRAASRQTSVAAIKIERRSPLARGKHLPEKYGLASFYDDTETANGEKFDPNALTAAHRTLPFGTKLRVTNVATGRSVTVRVNDRGPFVQGRIVDVSLSAAETLGIVEQGVAKVRVDVVH